MSASAGGNTWCSRTRAARRRLDRYSRRIIVARGGIIANGLEVRFEHFHIRNRSTLDDFLHHIVL
jgi:hypothetical protein